jgi:hypothetical protein
MRVIVLFFALFSSCAAQALPDLAATKVLPNSPAPKEGFRGELETGKPHRELTQRREIVEHIALGALSETFSMLDARSTREGISLPRVHESDPIFRPFVHSEGLYVVQSAEIGALAWMGWRMHHSRYRLFRATWWIPQTAQIGANITGWQMNRTLIAESRQHK